MLLLQELDNLSKIQRTVRSCTNATHLKGAQRMIDNYSVQFPEKETVKAAMEGIDKWLRKTKKFIHSDILIENGQIKL